MNGFFYVYILQSEVQESTYYVGLTEDLAARLTKHNAGEVPHTSKFRPWLVKTAIAFRDRPRAVAFERYLKSSSGRAFAKNASDFFAKYNADEDCRAELSPHSVWATAERRST